MKPWRILVVAIGVAAVLCGAAYEFLALSGSEGHLNRPPQLAVMSTGNSLAVISCDGRSIGDVVIRKENSPVWAAHAAGQGATRVPVSPVVAGYSIEGEAIDPESSDLLNIDRARDASGNPLLTYELVFEPRLLTADSVITEGRVILPLAKFLQECN